MCPGAALVAAAPGKSTGGDVDGWQPRRIYNHRLSKSELAPAAPRCSRYVARGKRLEISRLTTRRLRVGEDIAVLAPHRPERARSQKYIGKLFDLK
jgi:hypothetical protein